MSIYATLWKLKFPKRGELYNNDWIEVLAQAVPPHIGSPTVGCGYEEGDTYGAFLPPPLVTDTNGEHKYFRAVVFVTRGTPKGTARSPQEYTAPLLVITGEEYARITFDELYTRICDALRGDRPRVTAEWFTTDGRIKLLYENGTIEDWDQQGISGSPGGSDG